MKPKYLPYIFCLLFVLLAVTYVLYNAPFLNFKVRHFDSASQPPHDLDVPRDKEAFISFDFYLRSFKGPYDNLFQTAPGNDGLRIEIDKERYVWALVYAKKSGGFDAVEIPLFPSLKQWHNLKISVRGPYVKIWYDGVLQADRLVDDITFRVTDVVAGSGFSGERPIDGEIKNFKMTVKSFRKSQYKLTFILWQFLFIAAGFWAWPRVKGVRKDIKEHFVRFKAFVSKNKKRAALLFLPCLLILGGFICASYSLLEIYSILDIYKILFFEIIVVLCFFAEKQ
jgi:hypothetical protein